MINPDRLTVKAGEARNYALGIARKNGNPLVYDAHLLLALLAQDEGIVTPLLHKVGANVEELRSRTMRQMERYSKQTNPQPSVSRELNQVLDQAEKEAKALKDEYVSTEHMLLALATVRGTDSHEVLQDSGADRNSLL